MGEGQCHLLRPVPRAQLRALFCLPQATEEALHSGPAQPLTGQTPPPPRASVSSQSDGVRVATSRAACRSCELRSAKCLQELGQSLCVTNRTLLREAQAEVPLGVASSKGIEKCSPTWLPKDILTLVPFMQEGFWGPTAAPDVAHVWFHSNLVFSTLSHRLHNIRGRRGLGSSGYSQWGPDGSSVKVGREASPSPQAASAGSAPSLLDLTGGRSGQRLWPRSPGGSGVRPGEGQAAGQPWMEVTAFPAPCELADICSKSPSPVAKLRLPVWDERQQRGLVAPSPPRRPWEVSRLEPSSGCVGGGRSSGVTQYSGGPHHVLGTPLSQHPIPAPFVPFLWPRRAACGILVPRPGIEPVPPALGAWSLNHWAAREVPVCSFIDRGTEALRMKSAPRVPPQTLGPSVQRAAFGDDKRPAYAHRSLSFWLGSGESPFLLVHFLGFLRTYWKDP